MKKAEAIEVVGILACMVALGFILCVALLFLTWMLEAMK